MLWGRVIAEGHEVDQQASAAGLLFPDPQQMDVFITPKTGSIKFNTYLRNYAHNEVYFSYLISAGAV